MKVRFTQAAEADFDAIAEWIGEDNPHRAVTFLLELRARCQALRTHSKRFPIVQHVAGEPIRKLTHKNYFDLLHPERRLRRGRARRPRLQRLGGPAGS